MAVKLFPYRCSWIFFLTILSACGFIPSKQPIASTATSTPTFAMTASPTEPFSPPIALTPSPTLLPSPPTPNKPFTLDNIRMAFMKDGNLYVQDGLSPPIRLTRSGKDRAPIFSDDGEKIVFYRGEADDNVYSINANGNQEQLIIVSKSLPPLGQGEVKALTFVPGTHYLLFNTYLCNPPRHPGWPSYDAPDCTVGIYSVDTDSGEIHELVAGRSGNTMQERNFEVSPNGMYISIAASGYLDIYSMDPNSGYFNIINSLPYTRTKPDEFLPLQYWLPDSSGIIAVLATDPYNEPTTPPATYAAYRFQIYGETVPISLGAVIVRGSMGCHVSISPDRNWIYFEGYEIGDVTEKQFTYLANLGDGYTKQYESLGPCYQLRWSPDSQHFASSSSSSDVIGSIDGPPVPVGGYFVNWIDASHYMYGVVEDKTPKVSIGIIGGESIAIPEGFRWSSTFVILNPDTNQ